MVTPSATTQRVWVDAAATPDAAPGPIGWMDVVTVAEKAVGVTFAYDPAYRARPDAYAVSPELPVKAGSRDLGSMPGAFVDASADSWGQKLIRRQLRAGGVTMLSDVDALLGISDEARTGAFRFRQQTDAGAGTTYLAERAARVPVTLDLRDLRAAADRTRAGKTSSEDAIAELLDAGTAVLGGARPKALVRRKGRALLAKFPAPDDEHDAIRWEAVSLHLAHAAGLATSRVRTVEIGKHAVLVVDRFDRVGKADAAAQDLPTGGAGELRIPYWSARTATGDGRDYLDVARVILEMKAPRDVVRAQLRDLWRRVAFAVAVHCTDDHLRNLGFLRRDAAWRLCPVFDIEPDPVQERPRSTAIVGVVDPDDAPAALVAFAGELGIKRSSWQRSLTQVLAAVESWPEVARRVGLAESEFAAMDAAIGHRRDGLRALLG
ncbi:HipA domain-containing protein [Microbacterium schleiferi]|uniref:HipA domain-containing protein n=1 Tax=Microbacterium schleiferi TaxID=69362 RepID=A0A7S8RI18_9MICO|nr:HipA domain-containing protein [Microbacterium schleiferi]QPE04952.1 HipA domain-containing protein [Microbacterium schleiferi]